jgi:hypothetical protein
MWLRLRRSGLMRGVVEVAAEVGVTGVGVGEQVPDDDQDGPAESLKSAVLSVTSGTW